MKRRGNGEGCIRKLKDGYWEARIQIGTQPNGKTKFKTFTRKTRKEVQDLLNEYIMKERNNQPDIACNQTVSKWLLSWFDSYVDKNVAISTKVSYEGIINNHLITHIGHIKLNNLKKIDIEDMYNLLLTKGRADGKGGLHHKTVKNISLVLHKALDEAMRHEYIVKNPADIARVPAMRNTNSKKKEIKVLTREEGKALEDICVSDVYETVIKMTLYTGMRKGEVLGLKWTDIDYEKKAIIVKRQVSRLKDYDPNAKAKTKLGIQEYTKTKSSNRIICLPDKVMLWLEEHKRCVEANKRRWGKAYNDLGMIFSREDGYYIDPDTLSDHYHKKLEEAGLKKYTFHALRHTFATRALEANIPIKVVSEILGHASVQITMDTYSHVLQDFQKENMDKIAEYMECIA